MSIGPFKRRSSWASSLVTGLIGWNGFFIIVGALLGLARQAGTLFVLASLAALAQVVFLRLLFFVLRLHRRMLWGAFWGGLTGLVAILIEMRATGIFAPHSTIWLINGAYIGVAVGLFLCYFYRDDRRIEAGAAESGSPVDYGRDAHWLEPFFFGAVAYIVSFIPTSAHLAVNLLVVGAMSGVVAAGVSHFFLFSSARRTILPLLLGIIAGAVQGALSGLLFRSFAAELFCSPLLHGALAGVLTYVMTTLRGSSLANAEFARNQ